MKIVIAGGTGQIGALLVRSFRKQGHEIIVLSRSGTSEAKIVAWNGRSQGEWVQEINGSDIVINLAGRSVNCRYSEENLQTMMTSRVDSTRALGQAIADSKNPPRLWLQMSTATIYSHRFDAANDELTGILGGNEPGAPAYWKKSIDIAQAWENAQKDANTPKTRKIALRTAMVMTADEGGIFSVLLRLVRFGLGGAVGGGNQYVSWIHGDDFVGAIEFLIENDRIEGAVNICAPNPVSQREHMKILRKTWGSPIGLPALRWMAEIGAFFLRTDTELILKSRRVVPTRLLKAGYKFKFPDWSSASANLVSEWKSST
jgi:uncharacterized protein (TIGR01777 family)